MKPTYTTKQALLNIEEKDKVKKEIASRVQLKYHFEIDELENRIRFLRGELNNMLLTPFDKLEFKELDGVRMEWKADLIKSKEAVFLY